MSVVQIEGMEGLSCCSAIAGNVVATETESASWLSYGWKTGSLHQRAVVRLWIEWIKWKLAQ
jgi:hypothetical protein